MARPRSAAKIPTALTEPATRNEVKLTRKEQFLQAYRETGQKMSACAKADVRYTTVGQWVESDAAFALGMKEIEEEHKMSRLENLEAAATRRALIKSDKLAQFLLERLDPAYGTRIKEEHSGAVTVIFNDNVDTTQL